MARLIPVLIGLLFAFLIVVLVRSLISIDVPFTIKSSDVVVDTRYAVKQLVHTLHIQSSEPVRVLFERDIIFRDGETLRSFDPWGTIAQGDSVISREIMLPRDVVVTVCVDTYVVWQPWMSVVDHKIKAGRSCTES